MKCILCGFKADKLNNKYYHCHNCDLIFIKKEYIPSPEEEKERYRGHNNNHNQNGYVKMFEEFMKKAISPYLEIPYELTDKKIRVKGKKLAGGTKKVEKKNLPSQNLKSVSLKVLDYGCGPGPVLADLLSWQGFDVDVYDPYFYPDKKYKSKRYDLITCTEVLEHIAKPYQVLRDLLEHLKPGGIMAVMTHFHQKDDADFDFKQWWYNNDPTHITFYSRKTIKWIASEFELKLIYLGKSKMATFQKA